MAKSTKKKAKRNVARGVVHRIRSLEVGRGRVVAHSGVVDVEGRGRIVKGERRFGLIGNLFGNRRVRTSRVPPSDDASHSLKKDSGASYPPWTDTSRRPSAANLADRIWVFGPSCDDSMITRVWPVARFDVTSDVTVPRACSSLRSLIVSTCLPSDAREVMVTKPGC